jgi:hypothetical protein
MLRHQSQPIGLPTVDRFIGLDYPVPVSRNP